MCWLEGMRFARSKAFIEILRYPDERRAWHEVPGTAPSSWLGSLNLRFEVSLSKKADAGNKKLGFKCRTWFFKRVVLPNPFTCLLQV